MSLREMDQFNEIIDEIKGLISWYEEKHIDQTSIRIFLASGDCIKYKVFKDSIAHMLGIKTDYLSTCGIFNTTKSYELIKELIKNQYRISGKIKDDKIKLSNIFSKHIHRKLNIFKSNIGIDLENTLFVCKYNREKVTNYGGTPRNCDYIIVKELEDGKIEVLDIVSSGNYYKPVSSRLYENEIEAKEHFTNLLKYQEISILTSIIIETGYFDENKRVYLNNDTKRTKIQELENLSYKYDCSIIDHGDYKYQLKKGDNERNKSQNDYDVYDKIINCILNGNIIDVKKLGTYDIKPQTRKLINAINDRLMLGNNNPDNERSYSSLEEKVTRLTEANKVFMEENKTLKEENASLTDENGRLKNDVAKTKVLINTFKNAIDEYEEV